MLTALKLFSSSSVFIIHLLTVYCPHFNSTLFPFSNSIFLSFLQIHTFPSTQLFPSIVLCPFPSTPLLSLQLHSPSFKSTPSFPSNPLPHFLQHHSPSLNSTPALYVNSTPVVPSIPLPFNSTLLPSTPFSFP